MSLNKVLFVEDELFLAEIVKETLETKLFEVTHVSTLKMASAILSEQDFDIIVLDVMLPDGNGFDWLKNIRSDGVTLPVIFLTSRSQTEDIVRGFEEGGNDYLKKPFSMAELEVRMKALLRKEYIPVQSKNDQYQWKIRSYTFAYPSGELIVDNKVIQLTSREADILQLLLLNTNQSLSRNELLERFWGNTDYFSGRSLDVFISKLRRYLKTDEQVKIINVRGIGYKMVY
ncbi:response regulator transcription factor [Gynurincola endophyticus]|uniref:response regulator transcription factor n=1 Tax=Gynurincola endophyticus TaxID=2479004 RepID=UPI000F8D6A97|nr:response regulator transcription factor [Gynurincola endophyticus]